MAKRYHVAHGCCVLLKSRTFCFQNAHRAAIKELSQGTLKKEATLPGTRFYESLQAALKKTTAKARWHGTGTQCL